MEAKQIKKAHSITKSVMEATGSQVIYILQNYKDSTEIMVLEIVEPIKQKWKITPNGEAIKLN